MKLPLYNNCKEVNYHDTLYCLMMYRYTRKAQRDFTFRKERIQRIRLRGGSLKGFDALKIDSDQFWNLSVQEQETFLEISDPQFQNVVNRLENKGFNTKVRIQKLNEVRRDRRKIWKRSYPSAVKYENQVYDISHLMAAQSI